MQAMILKQLIYIECSPTKNVRFFTTTSCFQIKKNLNKKINHLSVNKQSNDFIIPNARKSKLKPTKMYLLNRRGAQQYASMIIDELLKNNVPVLEMHPGPGFLTRALLDAGIPEIYLYEQKEEFIELLQTMSKSYAQRIHLRQYNLTELYRLAYLDFLKNEENLPKIFDGMKLANDFSKPSFQIVGPMPNIALPNFIASVNPTFFFKYKNVVLYVATLPSVLKIFDDIPKSSFHKPTNVYLRIRFKYKVLGEIPREYFYPLSYDPKVEKLRSNSYFKDDWKTIYIIKLELNHDVNQQFTKTDWYHFLNFLRMSMKPCNARVIPTLEKWIPGCGPKLILHDLNIHSTFNELKSRELLNLFNIFRALPGYESSLFMSILESGKPDYSEIQEPNDIVD